MLQGHTTAIVPCGNPTPKKLPTGGGEWPTFRTARAQRTVRPLCIPTAWSLLTTNFMPWDNIWDHNLGLFYTNHPKKRGVYDTRACTLI